MFDGSYKSRRRQVNLGGRRPQSKDSILEQSRKQREQRQLQQQRERASKNVQRVVRGHQSRRVLAQQLEQSWTTISITLEQHTRNLNVRLGLTCSNEQIQVWLQDYARHIEHCCSENSPNTTSTTTYAHRIVQATLQRLRDVDSSNHQKVCTRILQYCLASPSIWSALGGTRGFLELVETIWQTTPHQQNDTALLLWQYLQQAVPATRTGKAILGALALSSLTSKPLENSDWFMAMVQALKDNASNCSSDPLGQAVVHMVQSRPTVVLQNALQQSPSATAMVRLLDSVWNDDLQVLTGCVVRGEDPMQSILSSSSSSSSDTNVVMDVDAISEESDDDDEEAERTVSKMSRTAGRALKQEIQTVPKLDRLYHDERTQWRKQVLMRIAARSDQESMIQLARELGNPEQWLAWGNSLLSTVQDSEELSQARESYVKLLASLLQSCTGLKARQSASSPFLSKLAFSQGLVEKLWRYVLVQLHNAEATEMTYTALGVFCDVFSHRLVALKDDDFLANHSTMQGSRVILAEHVIVHLRNLLYELYWSKPVRVPDMKLAVGSQSSKDDGMQASRSLLLLAGTKLWNSLYERWCRLVRKAPFCDESTWLFPSMTTLAGDSAVDLRQGNADDSDGMDLDSDEEDHPMSAADAESDALASSFSDPKMARILTCIPQALPFSKRVKLFDSLLRADKLRTQDENQEMHQAMMAMMRGEEGEFGGRERVEIHRDRLYDDSMRQLNRLGPKLKRKVQVSFINQHGAQEAGIDGGGVFKEFIDDLIRDAFSTENSTAPLQLFTVTPLQTLTVNPELTEDRSLLSHYQFLGRVLGKAVYESILVEPQFCLPFLNQLLGKHNSLEDLKNFDPEYYKNLTMLTTLSEDEIQNMGMTFELTIGTGNSTRTIELVTGGHSKPVAKHNVIQYVHLVAHHRLNVQAAMQVKAFLRGFRDLIPAAWVRLFSAYELQKLVSGDDSVRGIDVASLKSHMQYAAGYHPSQSIVQDFWEIVESMTADQQRKFLKFMTSCSRQPLLGFGSLEPAPCLQQIRLPEALFLGDPATIAKQAPLPTSSTCMNLLKLPNYRSKELMRQKLLAAIEAGAGFELT